MNKNIDIDTYLKKRKIFDKFKDFKVIDNQDTIKNIIECINTKIEYILEFGMDSIKYWVYINDGLIKFREENLLKEENGDNKFYFTLKDISKDELSELISNELNLIVEYALSSFNRSYKAEKISFSGTSETNFILSSDIIDAGISEDTNYSNIDTYIILNINIDE